MNVWNNYESSLTYLSAEKHRGHMVIISRPLSRCCSQRVWLSGNALVSTNVVALRRARLVLGLVTVRGYTIWLFNQTTPVHHFIQYQRFLHMVATASTEHSYWLAFAFVA